MAWGQKDAPKRFFHSFKREKRKEVVAQLSIVSFFRQHRLQQRILEANYHPVPLDLSSTC